jgi:hypothetical protein
MIKPTDVCNRLATRFLQKWKQNGKKITNLNPFYISDTEDGSDLGYKRLN